MDATESKIVDSAITVFNDDLSATLETVAEKAGISRRTLHRYFKDRAELMEACKTEMQGKCKAAMTAAYNSSTNPVKQLENMLYAGVDCGRKYAFLDKIYQRQSYQQMPEVQAGESMDDVKAKWFGLVALLQKQKIITHELTAAWIFVLFGSMITTTINALSSGNVAPNDIKKFAWYSFSRSIGITPAKAEAGSNVSAAKSQII